MSKQIFKYNANFPFKKTFYKFLKSLQKQDMLEKSGKKNPINLKNTNYQNISLLKIRRGKNERNLNRN